MISVHVIPLSLPFISHPCILIRRYPSCIIIAMATESACIPSISPCPTGSTAYHQLLKLELLSLSVAHSERPSFLSYDHYSGPVFAPCSLMEFWDFRLFQICLSGQDAPIIVKYIVKHMIMKLKTGSAKSSGTSLTEM